MFLQKVISGKTFLKLVFCRRLEGQWRKKQDPDPIVRGMDPRIQIRIRIHTKMSWIRKTSRLKINSAIFPGEVLWIMTNHKFSLKMSQCTYSESAVLNCAQVLTVIIFFLAFLPHRFDRKPDPEKIKSGVYHFGSTKLPYCRWPEGGRRSAACPTGSPPELSSSDRACLHDYGWGE